ncbi:Fur family transcriptional regulator [Intrasporangium calvum]|uniref:Ferric uptake regulator, Fur family n=1 Tax=Intrasporangium calvum (strain ATCC 23552 / DSM 43043 / JCM 3097 / NBRC 12989 / NCIMB 10167 / NRRL B-3866 / 7 KIP) TaxID=710696 RepID=E6SEH4_INTC7|nr:transcriptional repressor [Intrasporangium calvum]ADU49851.1 ferric uptake regulator, Fur family [Intrasporangium calvum DSM 43043]
MSANRDVARVDWALARLRVLGERVTPAREAVLRVIDAADRTDEHLTAEQIGERVTQLEPSVHRATVYRTLTSLTDAGVLSHIHLGGSATVYHLAVTPGEPVREPGPASVGPVDGDPLGDGPLSNGHLHVQCSVCGRVQDAPVAVLDEAGRRLREELGFELDTTHAALLGRCADCGGTA